MSRTTTPRLSRRTARAAATAVGSVLLLAGCGSSGAGPVSTSSPSAPAVPASKPPAAAATSGSGATPTAAPAGPVSAADLTQAAFALRADDQHYRDLLAEGRRAVGTSGFVAWQHRALSDNGNTEAFTTASAPFTGGTVPAALTRWRADNSNAVSLLWQYADEATGPTETASDSAVASRVLADLDAADTDAHTLTTG